MYERAEFTQLQKQGALEEEVAVCDQCQGWVLICLIVCVCILLEYIKALQNVCIV